MANSKAHICIGLLTAVFCLNACSQDKSTSPAQGETQSSQAVKGNQGLTDNNPPIDIRITAEIIDAPAPVAMSFISNPIASWLGFIIYTDENGDIYRTTTRGDAPTKIITGNYRDLIGYTRKGEPGGFFAHTNEGQLDAFIESDTDGNFKQLPISFDSAYVDADQFCMKLHPESAQHWILTRAGNLQKLDIEIVDNEVAILAFEPEAKLDTQFNQCWIDENDHIIAVAKTKEDPHLMILPSHESEDPIWQRQELSIYTPHIWPLHEGAYIQRFLEEDNEADGPLMIVKDDTAYEMIIGAGLSLSGIENPRPLFITRAEMGSSFNQGLVITGDVDNNRLGMIALDYIERIIETP